MEQFQNVLEVIKKHHFWILACLVLVMSLGIYTLATGKVKKEFQKRKTKITSAYNGAQSVTRNPEQPNQEKIGNWEKILDQQRKKVLRAWKNLYQKQEKEKRWPEGLGKGYLKMIKKGIGPKDEIPKRYRELYRNLIKRELPKMFKRVNYRRPDESMRPTPSEPQAQVNDIGVVVWPEADRTKIISEKFNFPRRPSSFRVRLAQENYWVYQALLDIIKATNGDAKTQSSAAVKTIDLLEIGKDAAASIQSSKGPNLLTFDGQSSGGNSRLNPNANVANPSTGTQGVTKLSEEEKEFLKDRYVNEDLLPLPAGQHPYSEFKMMPIMMRLKIDQRKISDLLVACANSTMPVEVKRYRRNPKGASGTPRGQERTPARSGARGRPTVRSTEEDPQVVSIEIQGIIYLYNPPDKNAVGTGTLAE